MHSTITKSLVAMLLVAGATGCADEPSQTIESALSTIRYEAEDATTNLQTETVWGGYSGTSYVCCWASQGQFVTFHVTAASAGTYSLAFRYSAGNGVASRQLVVNGSVLANNLSFAGTSSWSTWTNVVVSAQLNAGANTVTLTFNAGTGSANYINIDYLDASGGGTTNGHYEAELATSTNLPTETVWPGFSGGSYLCCWASQGQFVTFNVNAATAGTYTLAFGYSAGNGVATRRLTVNGASSNLSFPGTASWSTWTTVGVSANLNAGANSVTLTFDSPSGSANYINLDYLDVSSGSSSSGHTYNDNDPSITYSLGGSGPIWVRYAGGGEDFGNDEHSTNVYSSSFTVNFSGTDFQWIGKKGPNYGIASVYLDGQPIGSGTVDNYHSTELDQQVLVAVSGLANRAHVFRAQIGGYPDPARNSAATDSYQTLDAFVTSGTPLVLPSVAASGSGVSRTGSWTCGFSNNTDLSQSHCWSNVPGSAMTIGFTGTGIEVYARPDGENGRTDVYLDNLSTPLFTYDGFGLPYDSQCDDCVNGQNDIVLAGLANGSHTLKLVVSSTKDAASEDYFTQIDEFKIMP